MYYKEISKTKQNYEIIKDYLSLIQPESLSVDSMRKQMTNTFFRPHICNLTSFGLSSDLSGKVMSSLSSTRIWLNSLSVQLISQKHCNYFRRPFSSLLYIDLDLAVSLLNSRSPFCSYSFSSILVMTPIKDDITSFICTKSSGYPIQTRTLRIRRQVDKQSLLGD